MTITCIKTGRWWPCADRADGYRMARELGLVDYTIGEEK